MEHLAYYLYRITVGILTFFPTSLVARFGYAIGRTLGPLLCSYQQLIKTNLDLAFGDSLTPKEKAQIQKQHFALLCSNILSGVNLAGRPLQQSLERTEIEGLDHLLDVLKSGRGVLALMTHSSNWELVAKLSPFLFQSACAAVYQPLRNRRIDRHIRKQRKSEGLHLFDRRRLAGISSVLKSPGVVGVLADQNAGRGGVWCPLFGRITSSSPLIPILAKGTNAAVISIAVQTTAIGRWKITFSPEVTIHRENVATATAELNRAIEQMVRSAPHDPSSKFASRRPPRRRTPHRLPRSTRGVLENNAVSSDRPPPPRLTSRRNRCPHSPPLRRCGRLTPRVAKLHPRMPQGRSPPHHFARFLPKTPPTTKPPGSRPRRNLTSRQRPRLGPAATRGPPRRPQPRTPRPPDASPDKQTHLTYPSPAHHESSSRFP